MTENWLKENKAPYDQIILGKPQGDYGLMIEQLNFHHGTKLLIKSDENFNHCGVNHNSDINIAFDLVDAAVECGADVVKFQAALPSEVVTKTGKMADYQIKNLGLSDSQLEIKTCI